MAGFCSRVRHRGTLYQIQTQDCGPPSHNIETVVYKAGQVLTSKRASYLSLLNDDDRQNKIQALLKRQHEAVVQDISEGRFDHL